MTTWSHHEKAVLSQHGTKYVVTVGSRPLPYAEVLQLLAADSSFREYLTALLASSPYIAYRWETPPITRSLVSRPFEFVLTNDPYLEMDPEPEVFESYFRELSPDIQVLPIPNLSKTAIMVVPRQIAVPEVYMHIASFVRGAPAEQIHELWRCMASTVQVELSDKPLWISTAGGAVSWLHVRIEGTPKYYSHRPYANDA